VVLHTSPVLLEGIRAAIEVDLRLPCVVFFRPIQPFDEIACPTFEPVMIHDLLNFVSILFFFFLFFFFSFYNMRS
jgi:hypothetical protein